MFSVLAICGLIFTAAGAPDLANQAKEVRFWSHQFGLTISLGASETTCVKKIAENFTDKLKAKVESVDATKLLEEMRGDGQNLLKWKREAALRIALEAERLASEHIYEKYPKYKYANSKRLVDARFTPNVPSNATAMELSLHPNFGDVRVNTFHSAVQIPANVYEEGPQLLNSIKWSEGLTQLFRNNMNLDHKLAWQFFASSDGFMRTFPAHRWRAPLGPRGEILDFFDARVRPWYIQAAAHPKDVVILLDVSGSMTGQRREIAKNVVLNILDSLNDDDFVNVLKFSTEVDGISECFGNATLVPAIKPNIREFKDRLEGMNTSEIANFTLALTHAFELLNSVHHQNKAANCNQAIMLVTDGAPDTFQSVFEQYNWPRIPIRVFTYLVGKEVTETREVNWMACHNRGYYTHVANLAEVREQVQLYIPVMSRPLVLSGNATRPVIWTSAYADITFLPLSNWLWDERSKERIRATIRSRVSGSEDSLREPRLASKVQLTTTVATPVFDTKNTTNITVRVLVKNMWEEEEREIRTANLLGVAGVDVPISEIQRLVPPYKLGVNAYSFAITNNGMLLWHPNLRPLYQGLLKPFYNSVNFLQAEMPDKDNEPLPNILKNMVDRLIGWRKANVRIHMDNMRRVVTRTQNYYYGPLESSPFSLGISLPSPYGKFRVEGQVEVKRKDEDYSSYFEGSEWHVHPEWVYCEAPVTATPETPEEAIRVFLSQVRTTNSVRWRASSTRPRLYEQLTCEKDLVQALVFDAKATKLLDPLKCGNPKKPSEHGRDLTSKFGIALTFISTRSGLTRFEDFSNGSAVIQKFKQEHTRSIDEEFYKRAVDYHFVNESAFVFSVPIDVGDLIRLDEGVDTANGEGGAPIGYSAINPGQTPYGGFPGYSGPSGDAVTSLDDLYVTASRAIFVGENKETAPVAVAGALIKISTFRESFFNETLRCGAKNCAIKCEDETTHCLVVDNSGYILVAENLKFTGKYLGEFDDTLLESLITHQIFIRKKVTDHQAICIESYTISGPGSRLLAPFKYILNTFITLWARFVVLAVDSLITGSFAQVETVVDEETNINSGSNAPGSTTGTGSGGEGTTGEEVRRVINKTKPKPCIQEIDLLEGSPKFFSTSDYKIISSKCGSCEQKAIVQQVPYTNLISIVVIDACDCSSVTSASYTSSSSSGNNANNNNEAVTEEGEEGAEENEMYLGQNRKLEPRTVAIAGECSALPSFYRQRPKFECIASHPDEEDIKICGLAISNLIPGSLSLVTSLIATGISMVFLVVMTQA